MPYILNKTNGSVLATLQDGSINQTTDLTFVGKNYAGYGEFINEDLLKLLENFSNKTAPAKAITGQLWYDSTNKKLKVYNEQTGFSSLAAISVDNEPTYKVTGDLWLDQSTTPNVLKVYTNAGKWLSVGPSAAGGGSNGTDGLLIVNVHDDLTGNTKVPVAEHMINGTVVAVSSSVPIKLNASTPISGFTTLKNGITLAESYDSGDTSQSDIWFWGTARTARKLTNAAGTIRDPDDYLLKDEYQQGVANGLLVTANDNGVTVGRQGILRIWADSNYNQGKISAVQGDKIAFEVLYPSMTGTLTNVLNIVGNKLLPGINYQNSQVRSTDIGATSAKFNNIYATNIIADTVGTTTTNFVGHIATFAQINAIVSGTVSGNADTATRLRTPVLINGYSFDGTSDINVPVVNSLTPGSYLLSVGSGGNFDGSQPRTFAVDASTTPTAGKVVARDPSGNVYANIFYGRIAATTVTGNLSVLGTITATASITAYADVAERYAADAVYDFGTVLVIGGAKEVTVTTERASTAVAGIVSQKPAYMLNSDAGTDETHPYIALKGRVYCKVTGSVKKGELLVTSNMAGVACAWQPGDDANAVIGKALENSIGPVNIIEVKV